MVSSAWELRLIPPQKTPGSMVRVSCDPRLRFIVPPVHPGSVGATRSPIGSLIWGLPSRAAGLIPSQPPEQWPAISVLASPLVVMLSPPPVILIASSALELTNTPH